MIAGMEPYLLSMRGHLEATLERLAPLTDAAWQQAQNTTRTVYTHTQHAGEVAWQHVEPHVHPYTEAADRTLSAVCSGYHPWQIALAVMGLALVLSRLLAWASRVRRSVRERGALQCFFDAVKRLPVISGVVKREQEKMVVRPLDTTYHTLYPAPCVPQMYNDFISCTLCNAFIHLPSIQTPLLLLCMSRVRPRRCSAVKGHY